MGSCSLTELSNNFSSLDLNIRDTTDLDEKSEFYIPLTLDNTLKLLKGDGNKKYITERNQEFVKETGKIRFFKENDALLKPYGTINSSYDLLSGSNGSSTPLRYETYYRNYFQVLQGSVNVKLTPSISSKYLSVNKDYDNYEFRSEINPWNCDPKNQSDFKKFVLLILH